MTVIDLTGQRYGRLVVVCRADSQRGRVAWKCRCDCGGECIAVSTDIRNGGTASCGCIRREHAKRNVEVLRIENISHGHTIGAIHSSEYGTWCNMRGRCSDPKREDFSRYGGRGITVCERWMESFENFIADMGQKPTPHHSIDRINNEGNYEPTNCRWATRSEQARNTRRSRRAEG